jgi:hypothetical protein
LHEEIVFDFLFIVLLKWAKYFRLLRIHDWK